MRAASPGWYYNFVATTKAGSQRIPGNPDTGQNYLGTWLGAKATDFLTTSLRDADTPFYMEYDPITPHTHDSDLAKTMVESKYRGSAVPGCTKTVPETDRSDKPSFVQARDQTTVTFSWKTICPTAQRALKTIDDQFADMVNTLGAAGELDNTLIIFTSDNGLMYGEHGLRHKYVAYEPSIQVPLMISYPGVFAPGQPTAANAGTAKVSNIDILPTILDVAGINPDPGLPAIDGKSLAAHPAGHNLILSEYWQDNKWANHVPTPYPTYASVLDGRYKFIVTYSDVAGTKPVTQDLYDETNDPAENTNLIPLKYGAPSPSFNVAAWAAKLNAQRQCVAATCS